MASELLSQVRSSSVLNEVIAAGVTPFIVEAVREYLRRMPKEEPPPDAPPEEKRKYRRRVASARNAVLKKLAEAVNAAKAAESISGLGWSSDPPTMHVLKSIADRPDIVDAILKIHHLFGSMYASIRMSRVPSKVGVPIGIKPGDDIQRAVLIARAMMADRDFEPMFWYKYAHKEIPVVEYEAPKQYGERGPVVVLVDESMSMAGGRVEIAKALAFAIRKAVADDGRKCTIVSFSSRVGRVLWPDAKPSEVLEFLTSFMGGGTDFDEALSFGLKAVKELAKEGEKSDLVMITDGQCEVLREYEDIKNGDPRLWVFFIDSVTGSLLDLAYKKAVITPDSVDISEILS